MPNTATPPESMRQRLATLTLTPPLGQPAQLLFEEGELSSEPLKWLKYMLLDKSGVESMSVLSSQVHRFHLDEIDRAASWMRSRFASSAVAPAKTVIVAKVVPWDTGAQLRNYLVDDEDHIDSTLRKILDEYPYPVHELWCCESNLAPSGLNLGGRITFPTDNDLQYLELVWYSSPRMIERAHEPGFDRPYMRAVRSTLRPSFEVVESFIPPRLAHVPRSFWDEDFHCVASELENKAAAMQSLVDVLETIGAKEACFCFKVVDDQLTVIDWDTELESSERA